MEALERQGNYEQQRPLLCFSAAFSCAALLLTALLDGTVWRGGAIGMAVALIVGVLMLCIPRLRRPITLLGFAAGIVWCIGFVLISYRPAAEYQDTTDYVTFTAERYAVGYGEYGAVDGRLLEIGGQPVNIRARLYLEDGSPHVTPGETLRFAGRIGLAATDVKSGHLANGRYLVVSQKGTAEMAEPQRSLRAWGARTAHAIGDRIAQLLGGEEMGLLTALLTGDRSRYSRSFGAALMNSGTSHITAVSGLHISILVAFWVAVFGKGLGLYTVMPFIAGYALIAGLSPSVLRAAIMCAVMVVSFAAKREHDTLTALFTALLVLVAVNPFSILSPSLLLSFSSTLGIVLFSPMVVAALRRKLPRGKGVMAWTLNYLYTTAAASVASMAFTLPLCMIFFSRVSLVSALASILVLWAVSLVMVVGIAVLGVSYIAMPVAAFLARWVLYWPLRYIVKVIEWLGSKRWVAASESLYFLLAALVLLAVFMATKGRKLKGGAPLAVALTAFCMFFTLTALENRLYSDVTVHGSNGSAVILLRSGNQAAAINMGGIGRGGRAALVDETLASWGIAYLDTVVLSSTGYRNTGGLASTLERVEAGTLYLPGQPTAGLGDDIARVLCYSDSGKLSCGGFSIELHRVTDEVFIPRIVADDFSMVDLCGVHPLAAAQTLEAVPGSDILLIDAAYLDSPFTLGSLCSMIEPKVMLLCDDSFTSSWPAEQVFGGPVLSLSQAGSIQIKQLIKH